MPIVRDDGAYGSNYDFQPCNNDEIVIGGGAQCLNPTRAWINYSAPDTASNGWWADCYGRDENVWSDHVDSPAKAYAICMKIMP